MKLKTIASLLATLSLSISCISEPLVEDRGDGRGGTPTPISLSIHSDRFAGETEKHPDAALRTPWARNTRTVATDETKITELHLLVFDTDGAAVTNEEFTDLTPTEGTYRLTAETLPGNGMQFYVIANADATSLFAEKLCEQLLKVKKLSDLQALLTTLVADNDGLSRTDRLLMVGSALVDVTKPHPGEIPLTLCFLPAKVTVNMIDGTTDKDLKIDITGWDMVNVPKKSYLAMRDKSDAVTGTTASDYLTTHAKAAFETIDASAKTWSHTFYLLENRRGTRVNKAPASPAEGYPDMSVDDNDQRGKAWYAPAGATYLLVYGTYAKGGNQFPVVYKIYLGANEHSDYNVERGKHYTYNVTINGLNQIDIDTTVDWGAASFSVTQSDNLDMDAHPDVRVLRIGGTATDAATPAVATVEVMGEAKSWLAVSPLNLYRHAVKQASDNTHQQFAGSDGAGSFVRTKYSSNITQESTFENATFGMTRKLTGVPFTQAAVSAYQDIMMYADEYTGGGERTGEICITYYKGATGSDVAGQQTFTVTQSGAIQLSESLSLERYEEAAMQLHPALAVQNTALMQWGYDSAQLYSPDDRFCNGNFLTANAVYTTVSARSSEMAAPQWTANAYANYRAKYPAAGGAISESGSISTSGTPYYYPELTEATLATTYFHPIYNSSAARYCHEKNRDKNGDGIIDQSETVWYLPSYSDMIAIKKNPPTTQPLNGVYWTSTEEGTDKCWAFTFPAGTAEAVDKTTLNRVRCVRGTGTVFPEPTFESEEEDNTKIALKSDAGSSGIIHLTNDEDFGFPWTVTSNVPDWLQIATDAKGAGAATTQTGEGNATLYAYASTENSEKEDRTGNLTFTRKGMSAASNKVIAVTQEPAPPETANCYMLPPGSQVTIPVIHANKSFLEIGGTKTQLESGTTWSAGLVWESDKGLISLSDATGTGPLGGFTVSATNASTQGNAVVAIKNDKDEILWSWHIWVTTYDGTATFNTNNGKRDYVFMDRALGATSATPGDIKTCGLLYQWGRKDPFPGGGQASGSWEAVGSILVYNSSGATYTTPKIKGPYESPNNLTYATRHPDSFIFSQGTETGDWFVSSGSQASNDDLWGNRETALPTPVKKSVFDPCPAGWRVPPSVSNTSPYQSLKLELCGDHGHTWSGTGGYFPASGFYMAYNGNFAYLNAIGSYWAGGPAGMLRIKINDYEKELVPNIVTDKGNGVPVRCCKDNFK